MQKAWGFRFSQKLRNKISGQRWQGNIIENRIGAWIERRGQIALSVFKTIIEKIPRQLFINKTVCEGVHPCIRSFAGFGILIYVYKSKKNLIRTQFMYPNNGSNLAGAQGLEPWAYGFGDRRSTN